ncbi:dolichyl-P-Man:Man(7)GlcNAc(2)-PP-dolichol alpha-1,6-mannosyltransferase [Toensbergia leucococca]|nr:dolichyl-P-Man:Man(7)GlcNAc(2)-PP-dolichol alpha-1,6-mannosyltransferase [Toensbergia leucococca]
MRRLSDALLASLIPLLVLLHLSLAPYTKVEESFNIQATHDLLTYGLPMKNKGTTLRAQYDHLTFSGSVPRTFVGTLALAGASWPFAWLVEGVDKQILVRAVLGLFNAFCILSFRNGVAKVFGRNTANWYIILQASQFHVMYYASRILPNFLAFGLSTLALRNLLPISEVNSASHTSRQRCRQALTILTIIGIIFRSELAILLATHSLYLLFQRRLSLIQDIIPSGLLGLVIGLALTIPIDSYLWLRFPLWPELSGFIFNIMQGQSENWGTSPLHFYFTSALPRLLFNPLIYQLCIPFALFIQPLRKPALDILIPNLSFVAIYSLQPHKEWRFIIYIVPPLLATAATGASWIWTRRAKSLAYRLLSLALIASTLASFAASFGMLAVSRLNYPGAEALNRLHALADGSKGVVSVHLDTLTCMTGVTRFLQIPPQPEGGTQWIYDKTEDPDRLLNAGFWEGFDYALAERPEKVIGKWEILDTVDGFAGVGILRPGEERAEGAWTGRIWETVEMGMRRWVTRGWWVRARMEPRIRVMRKQVG